MAVSLCEEWRGIYRTRRQLSLLSPSLLACDSQPLHKMCVYLGSPSNRCLYLRSFKPHGDTNESLKNDVDILQGAS